MIIDANTHITESGQWFQTPHDASIERLRDEIQRAGIDLALVVPLPKTIDPQRQQELLREEQHMFSAETFIPASVGDTTCGRGLRTLARSPYHARGRSSDLFFQPGQAHEAFKVDRDAWRRYPHFAVSRSVSRSSSRLYRFEHDAHQV
jgi:hypothetical protein